MGYYTIRGGNPLIGSVSVSGSKNSALPVLAATLLADGRSVISRVPQLLDIKNMSDLLRCLGASIVLDSDGSMAVCCADPQNDVASYEMISKLRASFLVSGPLLARTGRVCISLPGGCQIGTRPVDLHLKGFAQMGAKITQGHGCIEIRTRKLKGAQIYLDFPSVGATENLIMAAALADGDTVIENAAVEPEIVDLANFINQMGGNISGAGTDTVCIQGVKKLSGIRYTVIPDRIEAGTFAAAAAATGGNVTVCHVVPDHLKPVTAKLRECGIKVEEGADFIAVDATKKIKAVDIKTLPYPGFPTDMQAPYTAMMSVADGTSMVVETIFENRFLHVPELKRMGAHVKIDGRTAVVEGIKKLTGAQVKATDLRAGAALVIAGLAAEGETKISDVEHIERGYDHFEQKLTGLGADIVRSTT